MQFIQHNDSRRVDTHKDPVLLAPGSIERHTRPRRIKPWLIVGLVVVATGWVLKGLV